MPDVEKRSSGGLEVLADEINAEHRAFIGSLKKTAEHGIRAGELLTEAKSRCPHGTWLDWLGQNFEGSERSAQVYMQMFRGRDAIRAKYAESADLSISGALKEISAPSAGSEENPSMSRESLEEIEGRLRESLSRMEEAEQGLKDADTEIRKHIDELFSDGHDRVARAVLRDRTFFELGLAMGRYNMAVVGARSELKDYLDVLAASDSSRSGAIRERVEERLYRLEPLYPEEKGLLKNLYPEELARVDAEVPRVLFFADVLQRLDHLVHPADVPEAYRTGGLKPEGKLNDEHMNTPIGKLLEAEIIEEVDAYDFSRWPHPLLWPGFASEQEQKDCHPSEWWKSKAELVVDGEALHATT